MDKAARLFQKAYFGQDYYDPVAVAFLALMIVLIFVLPRKHACLPMFAIASFIPQAQRFSLATLDFTFFRIITIFAIIRVIIRGEFQGFKWNGLDFSVIAFMSIRLLWSVLKLTKGGNSLTSPLSLCGDALDMWGMYFCFRMFVRDMDDLKAATYGLIWISIPVSILMIVEYTTLRNPFAFMSGNDAVTRSREGTLRCMGAYSHPILAGCFWAVVLPYMGAFIKQRGRIKIMPLVGIVCACILIVLSGSSSPIAAAGLAFLGGCAFLFRKRMRMIRWVTFITVAGVQLMANSPIWKVFARVSIIGGSTGYYRFKLIDQFIQHWKEWILTGSARGTSTWQIPMFDIVNYYVALGLAGGIFFVGALILIIVYAYRNVGKAMETVRGNPELELIAWATGVSIFAHMMTFLAVTYYGQIIMVWFFSLAVTGIRNSSPINQRGFSLLTGRMHADPLSRLAARPVVPYAQPARISYR